MKQSNRVIFPAGVIILCMVLCGAFWHQLQADERPVILHSINQTEAPVIRDKRLIYSADLRFSRAPEDFWVYYDKRTQELVIDIYGTRVKADSVGRQVINEDVFGKIDVLSRKTTYSFNGVQTQIRIVLATGWHYEAVHKDRYTIGVRVWKHLRAPRMSENKIYYPIFYLGSAVLLAALGFLVIPSFISSGY